MLLTFLYRQNPFLWATALLSSLLGLRLYFLHRPGRLRLLLLKGGSLSHHLLWCSLLVSLLFTALYEVYFIIYECSVSDAYRQEVLELAKDVQMTLRTVRPEPVSYWLEYATLLAQLRHQSCNAWDHDADLSMVHPDYSLQNTAPEGVAWLGYKPETDDVPDGNTGLGRFMAMLRLSEYHVDWQAPRHLLQLRRRPRAHPHVDIWLWVPAIHASDGKLWLHTADHHVIYQPRIHTDIFPLINTTWINEVSFIPARPYHVSAKEFSPFSGSYLTSAVFRTDCFHNFFNLRWMY